MTLRGILRRPKKGSRNHPRALGGRSAARTKSGSTVRRNARRKAARRAARRAERRGER
jgi:hypothetical protein